MMTAIIMAGRTGAAFAAQLGTMRVNEEIDALHHHGHLALRVSRPAADARPHPDDAAPDDLRRPGRHRSGGAVVGVGMLKVGLIPYWNHTWEAGDARPISPRA